MLNIREYGRFGRTAVLAVAMAGCQDSDVGTIGVDRRASPEPEQVGSIRKSATTKPIRNRPTFDDLSPRLKGGEHRP